MKQISRLGCLLALAAILTSAGCQRLSKKEAAEAETILKTGPSIRADCIVTFYKADGSYYLTKQQHEVWPMVDIITISAKEPQGEFVWELSGEDFKILTAKQPPIGGNSTYPDRYFAQAVLNIIAAPFLGDSKPSPKVKPIKIEGQWYRRFEAEAGCKQIFYENIDTARTEIVCLAAGPDNVFLKARAYDYSDVEGTDVSVPTKIELFKTDSREIVQRRLAQIDYHSIELAF